MKRNAKQNGSGGRLRLGLLLATAAAFLLVPAGQAFAEPQLKINITAQPGASGEVSSDPSKTGGPYEGEPTMECNYPVGGPQGGVCENLFEKVVHPITEEFLFYREGLTAIPGPESKIGKWEVVNGEVHASCTKGSATCTVKTNENGQKDEDVEVNIEFENEVAELRLNLIGIEGGGGEVVSPWELFPLPGTPPMECNLPEGGSQEGICENEMESPEPGLFGEGLEAFPGPNSELVEWKFISGFKLGETCAPGQKVCNAVGGADVEINVIFACEAGKECPPPPPEFPLSLTSSGSGSGAVECKDDGGACGAEVGEGSNVELIANPDTGSTLEWTEGPCTGESVETCAFTMPAEAVSANAEFTVETFTLTLNPPVGEGTLTAECGGGACPAEIPYNTEVTVTATPDPLNSVASLTGSNSASGCSIAGVGPEEAATCDFDITADSAVSAEFVAAASIATDPGNVKGSVDQQTTLETEDCDDVDLGPFVPSASAEEYANDECVVTVTATGTENELRAADEEVIVPNGTNLTGHLTQEPGDPFTLDNALEVQGTGTTGGAAPSGYLPLSGTALLQDYGTPVSLDVVTVEFRQLIDAFEPLHTGTYDKTITLTLEQDVL